MQLEKDVENFKQQIILQEQVTNKLLRGDSMRKKAEIIPLTKTFKDLFKK